MYQIKEQDKTPEKQRNEVEIGNLPEKEFRIMIVREGICAVLHKCAYMEESRIASLIKGYLSRHQSE